MFRGREFVRLLKGPGLDFFVTENGGLDFGFLESPSVCSHCCGGFPLVSKRFSAGLQRGSGGG